MKKTPRDQQALPVSLKEELAPLLLQSDPNCVIGIGIRIFLQKEQSMEELIPELQRLIAEDHLFMTGVIGHEAVRLLTQGKNEIV
jgi:hypothetical protein